MIYFISDTHFGHSRVIKYNNRQGSNGALFRNVDEMDQHILNEINTIVRKKDSLYILGDFCIYSKEPIFYRSLIQCDDVHLILGNHDLSKKGKVRNFEGFASVNFVNQIIYCNQKIYMSHYPHRSWPSSHKGSYHLYGHVHGRLNHEDMNTTRKTLDVGVDNTTNYCKSFGQPWSFKEVQHVLNRRIDNGRI